MFKHAALRAPNLLILFGTMLVAVAKEKNAAAPELETIQEQEARQAEQESANYQEALDRTKAALDELIVLKQPWEAISDWVIDVALDEAVQAIDTPEERAALLVRISEAKHERRLRVEARQAKRAARREGRERVGQARG